jgi:tubulin-specific chaperone A
LQAIELLKKKIETEATDAKTMQERGDAINRLSERLTQMNAEVAKLSQPIADRLKVDDLGTLSETEIRQGIDAAKELVKTYQSGSDEAKELTNNIARADQHLRDNSVDAARQAQQQAAQLELMKSRMDNLGTLSNAAFDETKKFWQAMYDGAEKNDPELKNIEERLRNITAEEAKRSRAALEQSAGRLGRTNLGTLSANELRQSIEDAKKLQGTYAETSKEAQALAQMIVKAEEYAKTHGVEAVRQAQKEKEAIRQREEQEQQLAVQMRQRLMERKTLSADALAETKKYWLAQKNGAEEGTLAFRRAEAALKMLDNVESERNRERQGQLVKRLEDPTQFKNLSEGEINEAIDAAKKLIQTYETGSEEAKKLAENVVAAENHIKSYGIEAARAAQKEEEIIRKKAADELEKRMSGTVVTSDDAQRLANNLTDEAIEKRKQLAEVEKQEAEEARKGIEAALAGNQQRVAAAEQELAVVEKELEAQRKLSGALEEAERLRTELPKAEDATTEARREAFKEKGEWLKLNDEVIKATVKVDELKEKMANTGNLKKQLKLKDELKKAEDDLTLAQAKAEEQKEKLEKANEKLYAAEDKVKKIEEDSKRVLGGRDYDTEKDKLENLERRHGQLTETLKKEEQARVNLTNAVASAQKREAEAAVELAQSQNVSQENMENAVRILEQFNKQNNEPGGTKWQEIEVTIGKLKERLKELKEKSAELRGENSTTTEGVMKLKDALELAEKAGKNYFLNNNKEGFVASPQQIQAATKAIEQERDALIKTIQAKKANGDATKEEEKKLADLTKKLKDLKFEQDNLNMSQEKMRMLMKQPTEAVSLDELRGAIKRADGELKRMEGSLGANSKEYKAFAAEVKQAKNVLKEMEGQAKASTSAWDKAWSRLKTYVGMYMGFNMLWQKMTGTMDDMMTLSDKMGEVRKTTGFTADEVGRLSDNLAKMDTRTALTGLMEFSSQAGSVGLKTQEAVQGYTEAANMLAVSLPEMGNEVSRTLMKISDATGDLEKNGNNVRETLERVGSTIIALRANSAAAASPIVDFVSRVGAVGAQAGISIDQIAALGATIDALGGRVEMSATALSRMIPAIRNNSFAVANAIGITEEKLKGMTAMDQMVTIFKQMRDSVKQFDMTTEEGMNGAADAIENMLGKNTTMQEVMKELNQQGARAGIVFGLLSQNVDTLEDQLRIAGDAYKDNTALLNEYNKMNDTTAARWERMKNQIEEMFVSDNMQHWLGLLIKGLREVVDLISMDGPIGDFFRFSLVYFALWKAKWAEAMGTALISLGQFLAATEASTAASTADAAAKTAEAAATEGVAVANEKAAVATGKFGKALKANLIGLAVTAVVFLGMKLLDMSRNAKKAATELDTLAKAEKRAADESVNERAKLEQLYKVTQDQNRSMEERRKALHDMVGDAKYKEYQEDLLTESNLAATAAKAYGELATQIVKAAKARVYQEEIEKLAQENLKLEDANEETQQYLDENKGQYNKTVASGQKPKFTAYPGQAAQETHTENTFINQYEQKQQDIIDNQEKIKKNNETIGKFEQKLKDTGVKLGEDEEKEDPNKPTKNPYGDYDKVKSAYSEWNGNDLVARRKEMLERVKALANGADVQAVLSEDAKFISDAVRKNIKTTEQAIEWYNTERLKIQEALKAKHLTPTGDWLDPKSKSARNVARMVKDDMKYYLDELDAYYTERKAKIQEQQNDQEISEAEARNRTLANEAEWQQRRAELQLLYTKKSEKVTEEEQQAIFDIITERTGETADFIKKDIAQTNRFIEAVGQKSVAAMKRIYGDNELDAEKSFLRRRNAIGQHMKDITAIVNKENPYAGITEELRKNLGTMDALLTDIKDKEERTVDKEIERTMFILEQSTKGYSLTWEELMGEMAKRGWQAWADAIEGDSQTQQRLMHQVYRVFEKVQDAIKKEASEMKKQADIMWSNILLPGGDGKTTIKDAFEQTIGALGIQEGRVSRANSLIGAGQASERVADKLAIQQMKVQLAMQRYQYDLVRKIGKEKIDMLRKEAEMDEAQGKRDEARSKRMQADNAEQALNLATRKEQTEELKMQEQIIARTEESQARLYKELREWGDLLSSSLQSIFEASNAGNADYYNERAKMDLTGKGGPGAGTYVVIDNAGTSDAQAHYEYLDERQALEREHEIEQENAVAEAWKKVFDDFNQKVSETITDQLNAMLQNQSLDANTQAVIANTQAIYASMGKTAGGTGDGFQRNAEGYAVDESGQVISPIQPTAPKEQPESESPAWKAPWQMTDEELEKHQENMSTLWQTYKDQGIAAEMEKAEALAEIPGYVPSPLAITDEQIEATGEKLKALSEQEIAASQATTQAKLDNQKLVQKSEQQTDQQMVKTNKQSFAAMTAAANMYGIAYQTMSNENLDTSQKVQMMIVQAAGSALMSMLTAQLAASTGETAANAPSWISRTLASLGPIGGPVAVGVFTALIGGLMGLAVSKISKSKQQIAQATGASVGAGRLATGMLTYAEGNVNEFTDPGSLTPGRSYNVDAADGKTYRAKYTGKNPSTHLTNGPEFHLAGEAGREMIIDAGTTRQITMNEGEIWHAIQTLSAGGSMSRIRSRRGRGVRAFADGNMDEFADYEDVTEGMESGMSAGMISEQAASLQASIDRQNELLEDLRKNPIHAVFDVYGKSGLVDTYDTAKKTLKRHGERH